MVLEETGQQSWLARVHNWRVTHVSDKMFLLILAFLVGLLSAVAAYSLHSIINLIVSLLTSQFERTSANWLYLVYPVIGIYLTSLFVRYMASRASSMPSHPTSRA